MVALYEIYCPNCLDTTNAQIENFKVTCQTCKIVYDRDNVYLVDLELMAHYRAEYEGARIAGLIPDKEWAADDEKIAEEKYGRWTG